MSSADWAAPDTAALGLAIVNDGLLLLFNGRAEPLSFVHEGPWERLADSARGCEPIATTGQGTYAQGPRSVALLKI